MGKMKLSHVVVALQGQLASASLDLDLDICTVCGADLMSDVLSFAHGEAALLLTGLVNPQVVRTAEVAGIVAIAFVRGKLPLPETLRLADEKGIVLVSTPCSMFEACGRLYQMGLESVDIRGTERRRTEERLTELSAKCE
jgi:hypothetical protein